MLTGNVIHGDGFGKTLGYPTANLNLEKTQVTFATGVYAATAMLDHVGYQAALVIRDNPWKVEIFLFSYKGTDFYGRRMSVAPIQKVSELEEYDSIEELKVKINNDLEIIKNFFSERDARAT